MKATTSITIITASLWLAACDNRGNQSGDTSRDTPAGATTPMDSAGAPGAGGTGGTGTGTGTGTATGTGTGTGAGTNP